MNYSIAEIEARNKELRSWKERAEKAEAEVQRYKTSAKVALREWKAVYQAEARHEAYEDAIAYLREHMDYQLADLLSARMAKVCGEEKS